MGLTPQNPKTRNHPQTGFFGQANTRKHPPLGGVRGFGRVPLCEFDLLTFSKDFL